MSIPCPLLLARAIAGCIPLRIRTPTIAANESNATPVADNPISLLLEFVNIFCTSLTSSLLAIFCNSKSLLVLNAPAWADVKATVSWVCAIG
jgi:hypothetical protein